MTPTSQAASTHGKGLALSFIGILVLSPDTLLVRLLDLPQWTLQFYRGLGMCLCLLLGMAVVHRGQAWSRLRAVGKAGLLTACCFAASTILFINALYLTSVANTLALISTSPIFGALFSRFVLKERLPLRTWLATVGAFLAVALIVAGDAEINPEHFAGDLLALIQAVFMASAFVLIRSRPEVNMTPCMVLSGFLVAAVSLPLAWGGLVVPSGDIPLLLLLIVIVLPVSFAMLLLAPRYVAAPEVSMIMLLEMVLGPLFVWWIVGEAVPPNTLAGGILLFAVLLLHSWLGLKTWHRQRRVARRGG